ncbi:helix-turn-helix domain-containing protein [Flexibacterium corallicola]|uniref:helix-turn-helix domain-containing protein n=1 Tax=Flexibacterium corallicola TaxID=3037259 RepID=UPI00286F6F58|nr:helix-turn-helix domain-containing protein [Pseudovibrio sp. M1P-2-3]
MQFLDIGEVSRRSGVAPSALRYYEEVGLIYSATRHGLRRQYEPQVLTVLSLITLGKSAGFSLQEIAGMFNEKGELELPRADIRVRADDLGDQIKRLTALQDALYHVADCPAPSHLECPSFQKLLKGARGKQE